MIAQTCEQRLANLREQYERDQLASARMLREAEAENSRLWGVIAEARAEAAQVRAELAAAEAGRPIAEPDGNDTDAVAHE